ncbi:MAG: FtsX-like permease family protein [Lachnospiraceae bacterium]|jgi:putative ABC transport system permease protein|uniref:ABC transporter permease n=1 Tax=Candidatus Merdisoma sp. JLR.KK006 TaxID=3112626 RepID=UPI00136F6D24|nr:FtsX-like permease family protein [Lachnospiraceae bacterium]NBK93940.1 FtsX-like permease family protein [bacterium 1XD21-13]
MAQLLEYLKMAVDNIRANKGRSILTMLGIIIGISSVIMIMSIGQGAKGEIGDQLNAVAGGQIYISGAYGDSDLIYLTPEDLEAIKGVEGVKGVTPNDSMSGKLISPRDIEFDVGITTGTEDVKYTHNPEMKYGRYFTDSDVEAMNLVAVIGENDARKLFGTDDVVGMSVEATIYDTTQEITMIGVIKEEQTEESGLVNSMMYNSNRVSLYMPYTANYAFGYILEDFYGIFVIADSGYSSIAVSSEVVSLLERRYQVQGEDKFYVEDAESQIKMITDVLDMLTAFIAFVAAIALLVGGIGVMNIMLVSVTERTREIGIRKALGARTRSIMMQFLSESAIITAMGGIIGIVLGIMGAKAICSLPMLGFPARISISTIILATFFSSCVGIFFGIYPARKAAKLSPIEALRRN